MSLVDALAMLRGWLANAGHVAPDAPVRIFEVPRPAPIANGLSVINRDQLVAVEAYAYRFRELQDDARLPWINVAAYGLVDGILVVGIELPEPIDGDPQRGQSVNFSGPSSRVLAARWDAAAGFAIVP